MYHQPDNNEQFNVNVLAPNQVTRALHEFTESSFYQMHVVDSTDSAETRHKIEQTSTHVSRTVRVSVLRTSSFSNSFHQSALIIQQIAI